MAALSSSRYVTTNEERTDTVSNTFTDTAAEEQTLYRCARSPAHPRRELAHRHSGGIEVTLYWSAHDNTTCLEIRQPASAETLLFSVPRERALDAFYHPFSHLPISTGSHDV
jgi:hypothetical protein